MESIKAKEAKKRWRESNPDYAKKYRELNKEKLAANKKAWYIKNPTAKRNWNRANPDKVKNNDLKSRFGITLEQYNQMFQDQGGVCKICGQSNSDGTALAIDHCHITNKIRGLLCRVHNVGLGHFNDNIELLQKAINYLSGK